MDQLHAAISIVEGDRGREIGDAGPHSPAHKKARRDAGDDVGNVGAMGRSQPAGTRQNLVEEYNSSLAAAETARKKLKDTGWIFDWAPDGKRAWFLYAYEIAMVGVGGALGCMSHVWGGEALKLTMNDKVLSIKLRQIFGKRNVKRKHAHVVTLARMHLIHCDAGRCAGTGKVLRAGLVEEKDDAIVVCGGVVCFGNSKRRHLEAKVCAINVHRRYDPATPGCEPAEKLYVDMWKARVGGASCRESVDCLRVPRVIKRDDIDLVAASNGTKLGVRAHRGIRKRRQ